MLPGAENGNPQVEEFGHNAARDSIVPRGANAKKVTVGRRLVRSIW